MIMQSRAIKFTLIISSLTLISCATQKKTEQKAAQPSPTVREAFLRINRDLSPQEIEREERESEQIAKEKSKVIEGVSSTASLLDGTYKNKVYTLEGVEDFELENKHFDIPVVYNDAVKKWMDYFLNKGRPYFERYVERAGRYAPILGAILEEHGLPRDFIFLAMAESGFNTNAKSWASAVGPWQFMPYTGKMYGLDQDWYRDERRDPIKATVAAARYLTKLYQDFGSWELAAAAYNAGEGKISRAIQKYKTEEFWDLTQGRYLKSETKNYVPKIMALAIIGKNLKSFGFEDIDFHEPLDFSEIVVPAGTDLYAVSEALGVEMDEILRLNSELLRWFTPLNIEGYRLRLPPGFDKKFADCCSTMDLTAKLFQTYEVSKKSMKIAELAKKFRIRKPEVLADLNKTNEDKIFRKGDVVLLPFRAGDVIAPSNNMYADLFEKPRREILRKRSRMRMRYFASRGGRYYRQGKQVVYTVKKGESLFTVAKKHGVSVKRLIASNSTLRKRGVKAGDKIIVR